jgi:hypothetical protein
VRGDVKVSRQQHRGFWDRVSVPVAVIASVAAIVATAVAVFGNPFAPDPQEVEAERSSPAVAASQISRCVEEHGLRSRRSVVGSDDGPRASSNDVIGPRSWHTAPTAIARLSSASPTSIGRWRTHTTVSTHFAGHASFIGDIRT